MHRFWGRLEGDEDFDLLYLIKCISQYDGCSLHFKMEDGITIIIRFLCAYQPNSVATVVSH
eukprot:Awhi_evm1s4138